VTDEPAPPSRHPKPTRQRTNAAGNVAPKGTPGQKAAPKVAAPKRERPSGPTPALAASALGKSYGELIALAPVDLDLAPRQRVALIGHNGSGKTTLLRIASGLLEPTEGSIAVFGEPAGSLPARRALSYLSDNPTFYDDLSVWEHLEYVAGLHGCDDTWEQRAADLLGALGLYDRADDLPTRFSRGLRQKASIALGLIRPFQILLVDEPFVGLDAAGKGALLELLEDVHRAGATVVVATHELAFVERVDRVIALRDGHVVHDGSAEGVDVLTLVS
jgi:ABC-2 type transport system ATP-binding protein